MPELRTVVITGAGTGIGAACARLYAAEGANLVLIGRRREPLEALAEDIGGLVLVGDAACPNTWDGFVEQIRTRYGRLDVLLACAGGLGMGSATETPPSAWEAALRSNLDSAFYSARACLPMLQESAGNIVLIASIASFGGRPARVRLHHRQTCAAGPQPLPGKGLRASRRTGQRDLPWLGPHAHGR